MNVTHLLYGGGGNIKINGLVSGKTYLFPAGEPVEVAAEDVEGFLEMTKTTTCCGRVAVVTTQLFGKA